jgi:hypothetical protein
MIIFLIKINILNDNFLIKINILNDDFLLKNNIYFVFANSRFYLSIQFLNIIFFN